MFTTFFIGAFMGFACGVLGPDSDRPIVTALVCGAFGGTGLGLSLMMGAP